MSVVLTKGSHLRSTQWMSSCVCIRGTFFLPMTQWSYNPSLNMQGLPSDLLAAWPFLTLALQSGSLEKKLKETLLFIWKEYCFPANINLNVHVSECFIEADSYSVYNT